MKIETKKHSPVVYLVYDFMKDYVGESNAIKAKDLSAHFGVSERELREIISEIRNSPVLEKIIGSSAKGYYICRDEEFESTNNRLKSAAFSLLKVAYANEKKAAKDGQMKIRFSRYMKDSYDAFVKEEKTKK